MSQTTAARAPRKTGRPSTYTRALTDAICASLADGISLRALCAQPGMPAMTTVMRWLADPTKREFREQYARAREAQADLLAEEILEIADSTNELVARARLRIHSRKWLASKLAPKKYGNVT